MRRARPDKLLDCERPYTGLCVVAGHRDCLGLSHHFGEEPLRTEVKPITIVLVVLALAVAVFGYYRHLSRTEEHPVSQQDVQRMLHRGSQGGTAR